MRIGIRGQLLLECSFYEKSQINSARKGTLQGIFMSENTVMETLQILTSNLQLSAINYHSLKQIWYLVITFVSGPWSVRSSVSGPSLNISETVHQFFLIFCMKLGYHKGTKLTEPGVGKKILLGRKWGKFQFWGHFRPFLSISVEPVIKSF